MSVFRIGGIWFAAVAVFLAGTALAWAVVLYTPGLTTLLTFVAAMCVPIGVVGLRAAVVFTPTRFRDVRSLSDPNRVVRIPFREPSPRYAFAAAALAVAGLGVLIGGSYAAGSPLSPAFGAAISAASGIVLLRLRNHP